MNNQNPKVTVRISAYNHAAFVEQAVRSVLDQTYEDFELIVIDDGSTDETPFILEQLSQQYGFYFERQSNMGLSKTLNKLTGIAKGEYISGVASDDYYHPRKLDWLVPLLEENTDVAVVHAAADFVDQDGKKINASQYDRKLSEKLEGNIFNSLLVKGCYIDGATALIRKEALEAVGGYDEKCPIEDWDMWLKLAKSYKFRYLPEVVAFYRCHGDNTFRNPRKTMHMIQAERYILNKWSGELGYREALRRHNLKSFKRLARDAKKYAWKYALLSSPSCMEPDYWRGWRNMLKP